MNCGIGRLTYPCCLYGFATPYTVSFGYLAGANGSKTTMLQSYRNGSDAAYTYTYDNNGNVTAISQGAKSAAYTYDALNQLTRVNDGFTNKTTTYTYDNAGNILERKEYAYTTGTLGTPTATFAYEYDSEWKDKLVSYNGETISYDEIGNPVSYCGYTMAWQGKRLESLSGNGLTASYTYDEQGIRSGKTINGVTTSFSYNGSLLMAQVAPGKSLLFSYDANGQAVSVNYNGTEYYYLRNGQNDIVGLMDESGVRMVEYIYDAWGKLISTTGTLATTLGADNPFRYRGYYYDTETGLYYLTTRYYDPEVCRFISADVYMSTGQGVLGGNMWAYCLNNPVCRYDTSGRLWEEIQELIGFIADSIGNAINSFAPVYAVCGTLPFIDGPLPIGDAVGLALAAIVTLGATGYGICQGVKAYDQAIAKSEEKDTVSIPKHKTYFYGADIQGGIWKKVTGPMGPLESAVWVASSAISGRYGKGASWGLYTEKKKDAAGMARVLGGLRKPKHDFGKVGQYSHYHVASRKLFGKYKHFHVWYGTLN